MARIGSKNTAPKLDRNKARDKENSEALRREGWEVAVVWQCETKDKEALIGRLEAFLGPAGKIRST